MSHNDHSDGAHPANACHQCGREMSNFKTDPSGPGAGMCPEHGVSYGKEYVGAGSIWNEDGSLRENHDAVTEEVKERVGGGS